MQREGCSEQPPPPSPSGAPQDTELPPPLFNQQRSPGVSQPAATRGKSASPRYINKKGVATNNGASSFSGDPHRLSQGTRPQELLPSYQVGPDGGQMGSIPAHPPAATVLRPCLLTPLPSPPVWVPVSSLPRRGASSPSSCAALPPSSPSLNLFSSGGASSSSSRLCRPSLPLSLPVSSGLPEGLAMTPGGSACT